MYSYFKLLWSSHWFNFLQERLLVAISGQKAKCSGFLDARRDLLQVDQCLQSLQRDLKDFTCFCVMLIDHFEQAYSLFTQSAGKEYKRFYEAGVKVVGYLTQSRTLDVFKTDQSTWTVHLNKFKAIIQMCNGLFAKIHFLRLSLVVMLSQNTFNLPRQRSTLLFYPCSYHSDIFVFLKSWFQYRVRSLRDFQDFDHLFGTHIFTDTQ